MDWLAWRTRRQVEAVSTLLDPRFEARLGYKMLEVPQWQGSDPEQLEQSMPHYFVSTASVEALTKSKLAERRVQRQREASARAFGVAARLVPEAGGQEAAGTAAPAVRRTSIEA